MCTDPSSPLAFGLRGEKGEGWEKNTSPREKVKGDYFEDDPELWEAKALQLARIQG